jgi:ankyrin repeat protein
MMASEAGHKSVVQILLEARAEIHLVEETNEPRQGGKTALACACRKNQLGTARMLLQAGADPNHKLSFGHTILDEACYEADVELIKLLLKFGGNPNASCGKADYFALERAVASSRFDVIKLLLDLGADINASGSNQETALMKASELMRPGIVRFLVERGANASGLGYEGATALYNLVWSAKHIRPDLDKDASEMIRKTMEVAKLLVERGADVNAATKDGDSPMTLAKQCKFSDLGNLFKIVERKN